MFAVIGASCSPPDDPNRLDVMLVGSVPRLADPDREMLNPSDAVLMRETAMGLVAFDASGQVEPALGESWILTDDGRSLIFRLRRVRWPNGREVTGDDVARSISRAIANNSENKLKPFLSAIDTVVGMTGRVVEIRLRTPRPNMLQLLAQPELGVRISGRGLGPWRITDRTQTSLTLRPAENDAAASIDGAEPDRREVHLGAGRASAAIAGFTAGRSDLVLGGTIVDWPLVVAAALPGRPELRRDPVEGLFGFAILGDSAALTDRGIREALSMAIDRSALVEGLELPGWTPTAQLLPTQLDSGLPAAVPAWAGTSLNERRRIARERIGSWQKARGAIAPLRVALPPGPAMRVIFAHLAADWRQIGVNAVRVSLADPNHDLRLIDQIAPNSSANWYLTRTGCAYVASCSPAADAALIESRAAPTLEQRSAAIARSDAAAAQNAAYIPLGKPVRWNLVSRSLTLYRDNVFAVHPLAELRPLAPR